MKDLEFWRNDLAITGLHNKAQRVKEVIQSVIDEFSAKGITIDDTLQLSGMLNSSRVLIPEKLEEFVFNKLFPETPAGINRQKYRQLAELPDMVSLSETMLLLNGYFGGLGIADSIEWELYEIENGEVKVIQSELEKLEMRFKEFAETKIEKQRLELVKGVCNSLNKLIEFASDAPGNYSIKGVTQWNEQNKKFEPAGTFVKRGIVDTRMFLGAGKSEDLKSLPKDFSINAIDADDKRAADIAKARN